MKSVGTSNVGQRPIDFYTTSRMQNARVREAEKKCLSAVSDEEV